MKLLTDVEMNDISEAVKKAESKTSGEIATAIINESDSYFGYELFIALFIGFISFFIMNLSLPAIQNMLESKLWDYSSHHLVLFVGIMIFVVILISYFVLNLSFLNRLFIPKNVRERKVRFRALAHFIEAGVSDTKDRTGVLIFISVREQRVELIADRGINELIEQQVWTSIVQEVVSSIKENRVKDGIVTAILRCGELLAERFPIAEDDTNELSNSIEVLEK